MTLDNLVNKQGMLKDTLPLFDPATIQHADQITTNRRTDRELRNKWFWVADHAMYTIEDGEEILYLGRGHTNPIFANIEQATEDMVRTGNYEPSTEAIAAVKSADDTLRAKLSDLELRRYDNEFSFFEIDTKNYDQLNEAKRALAERAYDSGEDFVRTMEMLAEAGIKKTKVYVLNPDYVADHVTGEGAISRACYLYSFSDDSYFNAGDGDLNYRDGSLRGVPLVAAGAQKTEFFGAEGTTLPSCNAAQNQEENPIRDAYNMLLADPEKAGQEITPEIALGLSNLLSGYLAKQTQEQ